MQTSHELCIPYIPACEWFRVNHWGCWMVIIPTGAAAAGRCGEREACRRGARCSRCSTYTSVVKYITGIRMTYIWHNVQLDKKNCGFWPSCLLLTEYVGTRGGNVFRCVCPFVQRGGRVHPVKVLSRDWANWSGYPPPPTPAVVGIAS